MGSQRAGHDLATKREGRGHGASPGPPQPLQALSEATGSNHFSGPPVHSALPPFPEHHLPRGGLFLPLHSRRAPCPRPGKLNPITALLLEQIQVLYQGPPGLRLPAPHPPAHWLPLGPGTGPNLPRSRLLLFPPRDCFPRRPLLQRLLLGGAAPRCHSSCIYRYLPEGRAPLSLVSWVPLPRPAPRTQEILVGCWGQALLWCCGPLAGSFHSPVASPPA